MSPFDKENIAKIMDGHGDWFTAQLLRLIAKADVANRERLCAGFPDEVEAFHQWSEGGTEGGAYEL